MTRDKRRKQGGPEYPIELVRTLARLSLLRVTLKARDEAESLLPEFIGAVTRAIQQILLTLEVDCWRFAEENENGWVDVYRVPKYDRLIWMKLKVEQWNTKETVIVISFHEYDDAVPI